MPEIVFDALVPAAELEQLSQKFDQLATRVAEVERTTVQVAASDGITLDPNVHEKLKEQRDGEPTRFVVRLGETRASLNQLAMLFARLLTPPVELPQEPALLENEKNFETTATYPWVVSIKA